MNPRYVGTKRQFLCDACSAQISCNPLTYIGGPHQDELFILCSEICMRVHKTARISEELAQPSLYLPGTFNGH